MPDGITMVQTDEDKFDIFLIQAAAFDAGAAALQQLPHHSPVVSLSLSELSEEDY